MIKNVLYLAGGLAIGYYIAFRRLEADFEERLERAEEDAKEFYRLKYQKKAAKDYIQDPEFFESAVKAAEALKLYEGVTVGPSVMQQEMTEADLREEAEEADDEEDEGGHPDEQSELEDEWDDRSEEFGPHSPDVLPGEIEPGSRMAKGEVGPDAGHVRNLDEPPWEDTPAKVAPTVPIIHEQPKGVVNYNRISTPVKDEKSNAEKEDAYQPTLIDKDAFEQNDSGFEQTTVTYYAEDERLANYKDEIISEEARVAFLGDDVLAMLKAGPEAMGGDSVVYVLNTQRQREFEIIWSRGAYSNEVGDPIYASG